MEKQQLNPDDVRLQYYCAGKTIPECASQFGLSVSAMRQYMIKNRILKTDRECAAYANQGYIE
ncbi:MAG: hypothetical protein ACLRLD_06205 [Lachnospira sp.]